MHEIFTGKSDASNQLKEITTRFGEIEDGKWKSDMNPEKFTNRFEKFEPNFNLFEEYLYP